MINKVPFLKFREKILNLDSLEDTHKIYLPPIYKSFISVFEHVFDYEMVRTNNGENECISEDFAATNSKSFLSFEDEHYLFERFKAPEEIFEFYPNKNNEIQDCLFISNHSGGHAARFGPDGTHNQITNHTDVSDSFNYDPDPN